MKRVTLFCLVVGLAVPSAAEEPIPFGFYKDVQPAVTEDGVDAPIVGAILDSQVYFRARDGYPDLRVFDEAAQSRRHVHQPHFGIVAILKAVRAVDGLLQEVAQLGALLLVSGLCRRR